MHTIIPALIHKKRGIRLCCHSNIMQIYTHEDYLYFVEGVLSAISFSRLVSSILTTTRVCSSISHLVLGCRPYWIISDIMTPCLSYMFTSSSPMIVRGQVDRCLSTKTITFSLFNDNLLEVIALIIIITQYWLTICLLSNLLSSFVIVFW